MGDSGKSLSVPYSFASPGLDGTRVATGNQRRRVSPKPKGKEKPRSSVGNAIIESPASQGYVEALVNGTTPGNKIEEIAEASDEFAEASKEYAGELARETEPDEKTSNLSVIIHETITQDNTYNLVMRMINEQEEKTKVELLKGLQGGIIDPILKKGFLAVCLKCVSSCFPHAFRAYGG